MIEIQVVTDDEGIQTVNHSQKLATDYDAYMDACQKAWEQLTLPVDPE